MSIYRLSIYIYTYYLSEYDATRALKYVKTDMKKIFQKMSNEVSCMRTKTSEREVSCEYVCTASQIIRDSGSFVGPFDRVWSVLRNIYVSFDVIGISRLGQRRDDISYVI